MSLFDFANSVDHHYQIVVTPEIYAYWLSQISNKTAEFVHKRGPIRSLWKLIHDSKVIYVTYNEAENRFQKAVPHDQLRVCEGGFTYKEKRSLGK